MNITPKRTQIIIDYLQENGDFDSCSYYGEPGYSDSLHGVLLYNWNNVSDVIYKYLEEAGYSLEWSDEWVIDYNNSKAYRTSPDSYSWQCQVTYTDDGELLTPDDSVSDWLDYAAVDSVNKPMRVLPDWITEGDILDYNYSKMNLSQFESGWHAGQNDDPKAIAEQAFANGALKVVFRKTEQSQFYCKFDAYALWPDDESED